MPKRRCAVSPRPTLTRKACDTLMALQAYGCPRIAVKLAAWTFCAGLVEEYPSLDGVEYFCGEEAVSKGFRDRGLAVFGYDKKKDAVLQDINSKVGYAFALSLALRVKPAGMAWSASAYLPSRLVLEHCTLEHDFVSAQVLV